MGMNGWCSLKWMTTPKKSSLKLNQLKILQLSVTVNPNWLSSIKNSFLASFDQNQNRQQQQLSIAKYQNLRLQSIQYPYLKRSLIDHPSISRLIQDQKPQQSVIEIFNDLNSVWDYRPTHQDTLAYLSALISQNIPLPEQIPDDLRIILLQRATSYPQALSIARPPHTRAQFELAHLIRLSIKHNTNDQQITQQLIDQLPIQNYSNQTLIHGALLFSRPTSLQFILNHLNSNSSPLEPWIESDLVQKLSQDLHLHPNGLQTLLETSAKILKNYHHHPTQSLQLVESIITHLDLSTSADCTQINHLADQLHQTTGMEIFRDHPERLAGKLFDRISSTHVLDFQQILHWCEMSKNRGQQVLMNPLLAILAFNHQLSTRPELVDQLMADFQSITRIQSVPLPDFLTCLVGFLRLAIRLDRADLADQALELVELQKNHLKDQPERVLGHEVVIELMEGLVQIAQRRDQGWAYYERLMSLGRPKLEYFQVFLREYLRLSESPRTVDERPQALPIQRLMKILEDMSQRGLRPTNQTYANLLNHFSAIVKKNPRNTSTRLQLERIHTLIKLDVDLEPDHQLLHQLFKAFSYNGLHAKAWLIWERFFVGLGGRGRAEAYGQISAASLATMFDLAGFESERFGDGRLHRKAVACWAELAGGRGRLNKNLFDSWVECLCRARRMDAALALVFDAQDALAPLLLLPDTSLPHLYPSARPVSPPNPIPHVRSFVDSRTLDILLRFARREDHADPDDPDRAPPPASGSWSERVQIAIAKRFPHLAGPH